MESVDTSELKVSRRSPELVMRLERLGCFHQSRLSFMRVLTRRLKSESWSFTKASFNVNDSGVGYAVYTTKGPQNTYSLVAFSHDLPDALRSDRVIAEQWDATFVLFDGIPTQEDIARLERNVPHQEAGRLTGTELTLSRANRSVRLWNHVVDRLANGQQPDKAQIDSVGYLMRTTAVYGSGKFGAADRQAIAQRDECRAPFQVEMLTVYLIRTFVRDLVEHMARVKGGTHAVAMEPTIARSLGIGNSTGLGMAPFILNHPALFNNWILAKEEALSTVRSISKATDAQYSLFLQLFARAERSIKQWHTQHEAQAVKICQLQSDLAGFADYLSEFDKSCPNPWNKLYGWAENNLCIEAQECIVSLMLEPYGDLIDGFTHCMGSDEPTIAPIRGAVKVASLIEQTQTLYDWAETINWHENASCARAWYVSAEKLEPRLGERFDEPIADYEQPLSPARDAIAMLAALKSYYNQAGEHANVAAFLLMHPEHRHMVRRVQTLQDLPYGEIRDNTISSSLLPIDMLRCKLSFFGAIHFDPKSDRWVRIRMFGNAPYPEELSELDADHWVYPE